MFICNCHGITENEVRSLGEEGFIEPEELVACLGLDAPGSCGRCLRDIDEFTALARCPRAQTLFPLVAIAREAVREEVAAHGA